METKNEGEAYVRHALEALDHQAARKHALLVKAIRLGREILELAHANKVDEPIIVEKPDGK